MRKEAENHYKNNDFEAFVELFFSGINKDKQGIEFETWTDGGVNMVHYFHASEGCYFKQFKERASYFDMDEEIDLHRQDERYRKDFKIRESVSDFESYQKYLTEIASLIN